MSDFDENAERHNDAADEQVGNGLKMKTNFIYSDI